MVSHHSSLLPAIFNTIAAQETMFGDDGEPEVDIDDDVYAEEPREDRPTTT